MDLMSCNSTFNLNLDLERKPQDCVQRAIDQEKTLIEVITYKDYQYMAKYTLIRHEKPIN